MIRYCIYVTGIDVYYICVVAVVWFGSFHHRWYRGSPQLQIALKIISDPNMGIATLY